jgi:tetratricopeptide (TPR) repeat protein
LDMGTIDANHRDAANWDQKGFNAMVDHKYQKAADDFKKAADALDRAGDRENASRDYERAAMALDNKGDLKGAAHYLEKAGADRTNDLSVKNDLRRDVTAEIDYSEAGEDRMNAGKAAGRNHKEAAKQYGQAKEDFTKAADAAARIGNTDDIKK